MRHGWFIIPGVQKGDRTLAEQFSGLEDACAEAKGKTVLDLGCAEGVVSAEFARCGAKSVLGVELLPGHLEVARQQFGWMRNLRFLQLDLRRLIKNPELGDEVPVCDIVIAAGVVHKLRFPGPGLAFAASRARSLLLFRNRATDRPYYVSAKHYPGNYCHVDSVLEPLGWREAKRVASTRGEAVQYWRRASR